MNYRELNKIILLIQEMGKLNCEFDTTEIAQRVQQLMDDKEMSQTMFSDLIGIRQSALSQQLTGKVAVSLVTVSRALTCFPNISPDWLLFGIGNKERAAGTNVSVQRQGNVNNVGGTVTQSMNNGKAPLPPPCQNCQLVNKLTDLLHLALSK